MEVDVNPNPHFMLDSVFYTVLVWVAHAALSKKINIDFFF